MDTERPQRSTRSSSTSDFFICFTSMKLPSKSILSPGRTRDSSSSTSQISLSASLSRRLKSSSSIKGGQASPIFPSFSKKRGSAFDNPEPSSPKVTCIGQVRVKTKKQGKKLRLRSKRRQGGELGTMRSSSLRSQTQKQECLPHRNQRWVHLPMTICEALRALGSELNCFVPCKSPCTSKSNKARRSNESSCGVGECARWFVCLHEGDKREVEFVVGEEEKIERIEQRRRRHVFEDIELDEDDDKFEESKEQARVGICVPPKNALLLMRCRSDPVKMSALVNRFYESPLTNEGDDDDEHEDEQVKHTNVEESKAECAEDGVVYEKCVFSEVNEEDEVKVIQANSIAKEEENKEENLEARAEIDEEENEDNERETEHVEVNKSVSDESTTLSNSCTEVSVQDHESHENKLSEAEQVMQQEEGNDDTGPSLSSSFLASLLHSESEEEDDDDNTEEQQKDQENPEPVTENSTEDTQTAEHKTTHEKESSGLLPDCLLLMMYEPKLSMEVSKETWVCSTDFIRLLPRKHVNNNTTKKPNGGDDSSKKKHVITEPCKQQQQQQLQQPRRSSCHYPSAAAAMTAGESMASVIEQKLVSSNKACEPLMLKRCKSEPKRSSAKLEPPGVGF